MILTGRKRDQLERVGQSCRKNGTNVHYFTAELANEKDIEGLSQFAVETCKDLNVLVSFALVFEQEGGVES